MKTRLLIIAALFASATAGGAGALVSQLAQPAGPRQDVKSVTGVSSGVDGTDEKLPEKKGVDPLPVPPEPVEATRPLQAAAADSSAAASQPVDIQGVEGSDGVAADQEPTVEILTTSDGAMQSIRGIQGIDTVMLQNLEAVLRMQAPPPPPEEGGGGGMRAAAALLTMENDEPPQPQDEVDGRQELTELELEGS
jgi:hypothetical protein